MWGNHNKILMCIVCIPQTGECLKETIRNEFIHSRVDCDNIIRIMPAIKRDMFGYVSIFHFKCRAFYSVLCRMGAELISRVKHDSLG